MKPNLEETVKQAAVAAGTGKEFTLGEVAKHNKSVSQQFSLDWLQREFLLTCSSVRMTLGLF
jgi:hypothetical protein